MMQCCPVISEPQTVYLFTKSALVIYPSDTHYPRVLSSRVCGGRRWCTSMHLHPHASDA